MGLFTGQGRLWILPEKKHPPCKKQGAVRSHKESFQKHRYNIHRP